MKHINRNKSYLLVTVVLIAQTVLTTLSAQIKGDSLVNVAFSKAESRDLQGGIASYNVQNLLEKNYFTGSLDGLQSQLAGMKGSSIWGQGGLLLVDGVPRSQYDVQPTEIESITVLKGANAVVLYGSRAAKGVILITTKRGREGALRIDVRANTGLYIPKTYPTYLNAAEYMTLYNEACLNDGKKAQYDASTIYNTAAGTNPYRYPDMSFYTDEYLKKVYNKSDVTAEIHGGSDLARYYSNISFTHSNSLMKLGEQKKDKNIDFRVRTNVDMNLTKWLKASTSAAVKIQNGYDGRGDFWGQAATLRPNWFSPYLPVDMIDPNNSALQEMVNANRHLIDGRYMLGGTSTDLTNTFADAQVAGYIKNRNRSFLFDVMAEADLSMLVKGLSFKTAFSIDYTDAYSEAYKLNYAVYQPTWSNMNGKDMIVGLTRYGVDDQSTNEFVGSSSYTQTMMFNAQFNYNRTFANYHNVQAALLGWGFQQHNSADSDHDGSDYHRLSNVNLGIQAAYNYKHRYYLDFSGAVVHSAKLPEGNRNAFSPTVTLGWRLSDENFFKENVEFMNNLKLSASYGVLNQDIDISDYYMYKGYFRTDAGWYPWNDGAAGGNAAASARGDNMNLGFIQRKEFRVGLEAALFNNAIVLDANYFHQDTEGKLSQGKNTIYPSFFASNNFNQLSYTNYENDRRQGVDLSLQLNKKIGQVEAQLGLLGTIAWSEALRRDEVYEDSYQYRTGRALDASFAYVCEGFFKDQADIDSHAQQTFGDVKPGDLKYKDINGDKQIDSKDQIDLGNSGTPFYFGLNLTLRWKDFTFYLEGTGNTGGIGYKNNSYYWVKGSSKYSEVVRGRWTPETAATATYPRLTTTDNSNNFRNSTFWMYKTNRFDLTKIQLTYDLPRHLFSGKLVKGLSVYVSGSNLLTIAKEREYLEMNIGNAPQTRFVNLGFKTAF
ncbi:SusC/RagA family TonB-linked outer membrane protein [uncultured Bacteroides sp.]|uniref:SusC/RagA family TonB-linked outer membrane protein n=1 Tax=uncultured Bacteroides sp. TaxID=162156 RepID=UPI00258EBA55|nr:SusC/RagA family TonB-linked outer membrane protein [uncultured Bacteroides sp.]